MRPALGGGLVRRVLAQVGAADGLSKAAPVPGGGVAQLAVAVLGLEEIVGVVGQVPVADPLRLLAHQGALDEAVLEKGHQGVHHGYVDVLALAGALPVVEGVQDALGEEHAGHTVAEGHAGGGGFALRRGPAGDVHEAAEGLGQVGISAAGGVGSGLPVAGEGGHDDVGLDGAHGLVVDAQPPGHAGAEIFHHDVGFLDQLEEDPLALRALQVEGHALFVPVHVQEMDTLSVDGGVPAPGAVAPGRIFDFDDLRAEVCQLHGGDGGGVGGAQIDDLDAFQDLHR